MPTTHMPVGSEVIKDDGYWWVKVAEPNKWKQKHVLLWEKEHGKKPEGTVLMFLDGDHMNVSLDNLRLITLNENVRLNQKHWRFKDRAELQETALNIARLEIEQRRRENESKPSGSK